MTILAFFSDFQWILTSKSLKMVIFGFGGFPEDPQILRTPRGPSRGVPGTPGDPPGAPGGPLGLPGTRISAYSTNSPLLLPGDLTDPSHLQTP